MDDTSISTDSPSARPSRTQLKWTNDMEVAFIATMKSMQSPPTKNVPSGFTKDAYKRVAEIIKDKSSQPDLCDDVRMKNKLGALRNDWRTYVNLLNMQWPRLPNGLPTNTDEVLENYYKDQDPNARKFRAAPLRHFVELNLLFDPEGEQPLASPSLSRPTVDYQAPSSTQVHDLQDTLTNTTNNDTYTPHSGPSPHLPAKRPAETSISNQAKRILMSDSPPTQPRAQDTLRAYYGNTSQISPVAAATALFTSTFSSLPIRHRVITVKHFQDTNMAEIFLHTDAELREGLVNQWIKDAEYERLTGNKRS
ncbi:unnamed protein product [Aureobasidium vineae]|uniref:Myb/SANT-like domain-containing protein n=1 Tax=Aureobasidium vineae TaxID=2773715 RepID=A0A9N8JYI2_9PEZI|nr:unnamed protein product [Aureobasidium vineae]